MTSLNAHPRTVIFQPAAHRAIQRGIHQLVAPIRATLGPLARSVAITGSFPGETPELLDKGSLIARRIVALEDRDADMGAMLVRHLLWRLHKSVGDGTATAAVLFQAVYDGGVHYLAAGGNAMRLCEHLNEGMICMLDELAQQVIPIAGAEQLTHIARSICHDPALAAMLGEIFDTLGPYAQVDLRTGPGRDMSRQYVEGAYWKGGVHAPTLLPGGVRCELTDAAVLLTDLSVNDPRDIAPVIEATVMSGKKALLIVVNQISESVTAFLRANREMAGFTALAVKIPEPLVDRAGTLADLAALVGGRVILSATGDALSRVRPGDLGGATSAWADKDYFGIVEGSGDENAQEQHIAALKAAFDRSEDPERRIRLLERLGKFVGGSAILWSGGATESEIQRRKKNAESTITALRTAQRHGVVPGGGAVLLACIPTLRARLTASTTADARAAYRILLDAVEAPMRAIAQNAGYDPSETLAAIGRGKMGEGFDVLSGQVTDMAGAGILDSVAAYSEAVRGAISTAALALTVDVLVHSRKPEQVLDPG